MNRPAGDRGWLRRLPYPTLLAVTMLAAAALPVVLLGALVIRQLDVALEGDAVVRADRAVQSAARVLEETGDRLSALAGSYAEWPAFVARLEDDDLETIRTDILTYLVERGSVVGARVQRGGRSATAGDPDLWARVDADGDLEGNPAGGSIGGTRPIVANEQVYLLADRAAGGGDREPAGRLLLLQRLDARFVAGLRQLTGFEATLVTAGGRIAATTHSIIATEAVQAAGSGGQDDSDLIVARREIFWPAPPAAGARPVATLLLASRLGGLQAAVRDLPGLVVGLLGATSMLAVLFAIVLAAVLRQRLRLIHEGLAAVADGRVPPPHGAGHDELARVAAGLDRLVATLDRRESTIRQGLLALGAVRPDEPLPVVSRKLAEALRSTLGCRWVQLVGVDGAILASAGVKAPREAQGSTAAGRPSPAIVDVPMTLELDNGPRVAAGPADDRPWTDGDTDVLEVMALLAGTVYRDARELERVAGRAERLGRVNRVQRLFLRGVSHNLRSPLATVELAAADLEEVEDPFVRARAEAIRSEGMRLARLVDQVLLLSRLDAGSLDVAEDPVSLGPLARRVVREAGMADGTTVTDRAGGAVVFADEAIVEQVLWVLLDNARRYAPDGGVEVEITPASGKGTGREMLTLAVQDLGPGIPAGEKERIFRRFQRGSTAGGQIGTGLGLHLARGLARAMNGDLKLVPSTSGARFEILLPKAIPDPFREPAAADVPRADAGMVS